MFSGFHSSGDTENGKTQEKAKEKCSILTSSQRTRLGSSVRVLHNHCKWKKHHVIFLRTVHSSLQVHPWQSHRRSSLAARLDWQCGTHEDAEGDKTDCGVAVHDGGVGLKNGAGDGVGQTANLRATQAQHLCDATCDHCSRNNGVGATDYHSPLVAIAFRSTVYRPLP